MCFIIDGIHACEGFFNMNWAIIFTLGILAGWILRGLAELINEKVWKGGKK